MRFSAITQLCPQPHYIQAQKKLTKEPDTESKWHTLKQKVNYLKTVITKQ
jgi:hypothetical protein